MSDSSAPLRPWCRLDAAIYTDAALMRAGFEACAVFPALIVRAKLLGRYGGRLHADDVDPVILARFMNGDKSNVTFVSAGLDALRAAGKIVPLEDGGVVIENWARFQSDPGNAARQARFKAKQAAAKSSQDGETDVPSNVTERLGNEVTATGRDGTGESNKNPPPRDAYAGGAGNVTDGGGSSTSSDGTTDEPLSREDEAVATTIIRCLRQSESEFDRRAGEKAFAALRDRTGTPSAARAFIDRFTARFPDEVTKTRRPFAMARNGRKAK